jgi:hypothetical protein
MNDHDLLIGIRTDVGHIRDDIREIKDTNTRQWEAINTNSENIKSTTDRFNDHIITPHCGEDEKEAKEAAKAIVTLVNFFKSKQGKRSGVITIVLVIVAAAYELGLIPI